MARKRRKRNDCGSKRVAYLPNTTKPVSKVPRGRTDNDSVESELIRIGFTSKEKEDWLKRVEKHAPVAYDLPRFTYKLGSLRCMTPNHDCPWWTIQFVSSGDVRWYVDFPLTVPTEMVVGFVTS